MLFMLMLMKMFEIIDATGSGDKQDPRMRDIEAEMIRSRSAEFFVSLQCQMREVAEAVIKDKNCEI